MKLLCINTGTINKKINGNLISFTGGDYGLEEGKIYETKGKAFKTTDDGLGYGQWCYYIEGVGIRLCERFTEALPDKEEMITFKEKLTETCLN